MSPIRGTVSIASAGPAHLDWLIAQEDHVSAQWVRRCLAAGEYLVAEVDGVLIGYLRFSWFWGAFPYMEMIRVAPQRQRRGVGSALVAHWEAAMRRAGAKILMTSSMSEEPEPQAWHRRNGFRESGSLTFGKVEPTPEVFFVKDL